MSYQLTFTVDTTSRISKISSSTHPIEISDPTQTTANINLANTDSSVPLLQNFDLAILLAEPDKYSLIVVAEIYNLFFV